MGSRFPLKESMGLTQSKIRTASRLLTLALGLCLAGAQIAQPLHHLAGHDTVAKASGHEVHDIIIEEFSVQSESETPGLETPCLLCSLHGQTRVALASAAISGVPLPITSMVAGSEVSAYLSTPSRFLPGSRAPPLSA